MESKKVKLLGAILKIRDESKPNKRGGKVEQEEDVLCVSSRNNKFIELILLEF